MRKIYKGLLATILIISILTAIAISSPTGPYTGCVSRAAGGVLYDFQPGNTPIVPCKNTDYQITVYEKNFIDSTINNIQTQINSILGKVTDLENNQPVIYYKQYTYTPITQANIWTKLAEYTFYLPTWTYARIEGNGAVYMFDDVFGTYIEVDGVSYTLNWYAFYSPGMWTGFSNPVVLYLGPGYHTVRMYGDAYGIESKTGANTAITVQMTNKGSIFTTSTPVDILNTSIKPPNK